jgi:hypothetical protein
MQKMCEDCGVFFDEPEYIVYDLYNYQAKPQRFYNRLDHFKEVLSQFQGSEGKEIPKEIVEQIKAKLPESKDASAVKSVMRKLKLTKYMENFNYIVFAVTGTQPPYIPKLVQEKLIRMFKQIDRAFGNVQKDKRKSFLNYYYILYKLLELMGQTELLPDIPLLRTRVRLRQHDAIWKLLCEELDWKFVPTESSPPKVQRKRRGKPPGE